MSNMDKLSVNYGFFSGGGVDPEFGLTNHNLGEAEISREMFQKSQTKIVLVDHTKYRNVSLNQVAETKDIDFIITDQSVTEKDKELFEQLEVELISVSKTK